MIYLYIKSLGTNKFCYSDNTLTASLYNSATVLDTSERTYSMDGRESDDEVR